jgi:hypothetical protein
VFIKWQRAEKIIQGEPSLFDGHEFLVTGGAHL